MSDRRRRATAERLLQLHPGMKKLARCNRERVLDVLTERLTFERNAVKLYDAIIAKLERSPDAQVQALLAPTSDHRAQEQEHADWLAEQIRALNGDSDATSEHARLAALEIEGVDKVILDGDNQVSHLFHALHVAELADNAGWDLLVRLADETGDVAAKRAFKQRLREEQDHLIFTRHAIRRFARREVLGENVPLPTGP